MSLAHTPDDSHDGSNGGGPAETGAAESPAVDPALLELLSSLTVPVIADTLDRLGYRHQVAGSVIRPVAAPSRIFGPAFTIQAVACAELRDPPYELALAATDEVPPGAVVVFNAGGVTDAGVWGELMTTRAQARGAIGVVVDGAVRDLDGIERLRFPTYASAIHAADSHGRAEVIFFNRPIVCGGVRVRPGDIIGADRDGVIVIPTELAPSSIREAHAKRDKERQTQEMLRQGASVRAAYERHGVL
jgi:4-hydroxy-4-methyl-2-oxoglutarate aldolase